MHPTIQHNNNTESDYDEELIHVDDYISITFEENIPLVADMQNDSTTIVCSRDNETNISQISESEQDFSISQLLQLETTGEEAMLV